MNNLKLSRLTKTIVVSKAIILTVLFLVQVNESIAQTFTLKSNDLGGQFVNKFMLNTFGCNGENKSPQLEWSNAPGDTKSFAITMHDADAPTGSGYWHWVVYEIPSTVHEIKQGAGSSDRKLKPDGAKDGNSDFGVPGYGGPCPPVNDKAHTYIFTAYALKVDHLPIDQNSTAPNTGYFINQNLLAKASIIVYSKR